MDSATLTALGVFDPTPHPSLMGIGSPHEGFSLSRLLDRTATPMGRDLFRRRLARPVADLGTLGTRLDTIEYLLRFPETTAAIHEALKETRDLGRLVLRCQRGQGHHEIQDFRYLLRALAATNHVARLVDSLPRVEGTGTGVRSAERGRDERSSVDEHDKHESGVGVGNLSSNSNPPHSGGDMTHGRLTPHTTIAPAPATTTVTTATTMTTTTTTQDGRGRNDGVIDDLPAVTLPPRARRPARPAVVDDVAHLANVPSLHACQSLISRLLDFSQSRTLSVQTGVSSTLDHLRGILAHVPHVLTSAVVREMARVPTFVRDTMPESFWHVEYMPKLGYAIAVRGGPVPVRVLAHLPDWTLLFDVVDPAGEPSFFYRANVTDDLNDRYGDVLAQIRDVESGVFVELAVALVGHLPVLSRATGRIAALDVAVGLVLSAQTLRLCRPRLVSRPILEAEGARHLLVEAAAPVGSFIPLTSQVRLGVGAAREAGEGTGGAGGKPIALINGPNASGKSVLVTSLALLVYMAHGT